MRANPPAIEADPYQKAPVIPNYADEKICRVPDARLPIVPDEEKNTKLRALTDKLLQLDMAAVHAWLVELEKENQKLRNFIAELPAEHRGLHQFWEERLFAPIRRHIPERWSTLQKNDGLLAVLATPNLYKISVQCYSMAAENGMLVAFTVYHIREHSDCPMGGGAYWVRQSAQTFADRPSIPCDGKGEVVSIRSKVAMHTKEVFGITLVYDFTMGKFLIGVFKP